MQMIMQVTMLMQTMIQVTMLVQAMMKAMNHDDVYDINDLFVLI